MPTITLTITNEDNDTLAECAHRQVIDRHDLAAQWFALSVHAARKELDLEKLFEDDDEWPDLETNEFYQRLRERAARKVVGCPSSR